MKPWKILDRAVAPGGSELQLVEHDATFAIRVNGLELMSSRSHASEDAMAESLVHTKPLPAGARVLIGGLGLGFTLRAVLDVLPDDGAVTVAELSDAVVRWNRGPLAHLAQAPLEDPRASVEETDVRKLLKAPARFHGILLDVDNGPRAMVARGNRSLYDEAGIAACWSALLPGGSLVVWSAGPDAAFLERLARCGFAARARTVMSHGESGRKHVLFIAQRPLGGPAPVPARKKRTAPRR